MFLSIAIAIAACSERSDTAPRPSTAAPDKAKLFGDPVLVPTRAGEAARDELAAAGEIAAAITAAEWIDDVHVDVEDRTRVVIAGRIATATDDAVLRADLRRVVDAVLGPDEARTLVLALGRTPDHPEPRDRGLVPLLFAAMGFGASAGIAIDRALRRRRLLARARSRRVAR
jgi:hypothetical protein